MTTDTVRAVATEFLSRPAAGVLVLKGPWGVGKTFAWKAIVEKAKDNLTPNKYSYVSLFGLRTISDLRLAILAAETGAAQIGRSRIERIMNENVGALFKKTAGMIARVKDLPKVQGVNLNVGLEALAPVLISPAVVCLDDFERTSINTEELLGFISLLKEEKGCKVVLIFNEGKLLGERKELFQMYREKIVDIELLYLPTAEEAVEIGFSADLPRREMAASNAEKLGINNIRILRKAASAINDMEQVFRELHPKVQDQIVATAVLASWAMYGSGEQHVPIEFLKRWQSLAWHLSNRAKEEGAQANEQAEASKNQEEVWAEVLDDYKYGSSDELDLAVMKVMERGYIQETGLIETAAAKDKELKAGDFVEQFAAAWFKFHSSLSDNQQAVIAEIVDTFKKGAKYISKSDMDATVRLVRELASGELADDLIERYINARFDETALFDLDSDAFGDQIRDPNVKRRFAEHFASTVQRPSLDEALLAVTVDGRYSGGNLEVVLDATADDIRAILKKQEGPTLRRMIEGGLRCPNAGVHTRVREAAERIAGESQLNKMRMERFGIRPPAKPGMGAAAAAEG